MTLKLEPITTLLIIAGFIVYSVILGGGGWIVGTKSERKHQEAMQPKVIVHDTKVVVDSKTTSKAEANAYSVNIFKDGQMFKTLSISSAGTNIQVSVTSNKQESWKTNNGTYQTNR